MHSTSITTTTSCDDSPDRLGAWLRLLAVDASTALSWRWLLHYAPVVLVFLANVRTRFLLGRTAVVLPARTGGSDYGARAVLRGRNPMVFGGPAHYGFSCREQLVVRRRLRWVTDTTSGAGRIALDWIMTRRTESSAFALAWPADCSASEAQ